ncbi:MAG: helical backbone metal receptor [Saprospiraceae bacterium]
MKRIIFTDQLNRTLSIVPFPQRIISLVPSITELLVDLGVQEKLVGRTKFCVHPENAVKQIPKIGGTKQLKIEQIRALQPDLIIANKEENDREQVETLAAEFPVWISDVPNFPAALEMILGIGRVVGQIEKAQQIVQQQQQIMADLLPQRSLRAAYLIWRKPYMTVGNDTYIHDMLRRVGFDNVFGEQTRYPQFTLADLKKRDPEVILLSSEPFPFKEKHIAELREQFPTIPIELVDGEAFSWYGTRLLKTKNTLQSYQAL